MLLQQGFQLEENLAVGVSSLSSLHHHLQLETRALRNTSFA